MLKIFFVTKWSVTFLCQNIILYMYIEKHEKNPQQIFSQMPSAKRRNAQNKKYCNPLQHYEVNLLSAVSSDSVQIPILKRRNTSGKQKNCHTISYNLIRRKNMLKIMSTKGNDNDHFNEINMPSYPQSKMPWVHLGSGREQWQETKSSFLLMWAMLKLQQLLEFRKEGRNKWCFKLLRQIRARFPSVPDFTIPGKQSLPELSWNNTSLQLFMHNPPDGGKIQL